MSAADHFRNKVKKVVHPSSATSSATLAHSTSEDDTNHWADIGAGDSSSSGMFGHCLTHPPIDCIESFPAAATNEILDTISQTRQNDAPNALNDAPNALPSALSISRLPTPTIEEIPDPDAPPAISSRNYREGNFFDPPEDNMDVDVDEGLEDMEMDFRNPDSPGK
jgi:hypothetical protein